MCELVVLILVGLCLLVYAIPRRNRGPSDSLGGCIKDIVVWCVFMAIVFVWLSAIAVWTP